MYVSVFERIIYLRAKLLDHSVYVIPALANTETYIWASLVAQTIKNLPAVQETQVLSLGQDDPLEKGMATHSKISHLSPNSPPA